jgi:hypothetical protein
MTSSASSCCFLEHANEILKGLWLGSEEAGESSVAELVDRFGITHVLIPAHTGCDAQPHAHSSLLTYKQLYITDTSAFPILPLFDECFQWIDQARQGQPDDLLATAWRQKKTRWKEPTTKEQKEESADEKEEKKESGEVVVGSVLVHCAMGRSRSAAFVIGYVMKKCGLSFAEAQSYVRHRRPVVSTKFDEQLRLWERCGYTLLGDSPAHLEAKTKYKRSPFNP